MDPKFASAYSDRGTIWGMKGDLDRAIADFDRAIELDPHEASFFRNRGLAWSRKGNQARAGSDYDRASALSQGR